MADDSTVRSGLHQLDGTAGAPCYAHHVRVRAGATVLVAWIAAVHTRAFAGAGANTSCRGDIGCRASTSTALQLGISSQSSLAQVSEFSLVPTRIPARAGLPALTAQHSGDARVYVHMGYAPELPGLRAGHRRELVRRPRGCEADECERPSRSPDSRAQVVARSPRMTEHRLDHQPRSQELRTRPEAARNANDLCRNLKLDSDRLESATLKPGKTATLMFCWGIVGNRLEHNERTDPRAVQIEPGPRLAVKW